MFLIVEIIGTEGGPTVSKLEEDAGMSLNLFLLMISPSLWYKSRQNHRDGFHALTKVVILIFQYATIPSLLAKVSLLNYGTILTSTWPDSDPAK